MQTRHFITKAYPFAFTNGIQASYLEVDTDTGLVKLLRHWCVEDCGRIINPLLVDEQVRGGIVQGIGAALYEECPYSPEGQLTIGSMADYLVPMAAEMPDIEVGHVETPTREVSARRQGRRRGRHRRRSRRHHERHQRRAAPVRGQGARPALYAGAHPGGAGQGAGVTGCQGFVDMRGPGRPNVPSETLYSASRRLPWRHYVPIGEVLDRDARRAAPSLHCSDCQCQLYLNSPAHEGVSSCRLQLL